MTLNPRSPRATLLVLSFVFGLGLSGCASSGQRVAEERHGVDVWVQPSPLLVQQIDDEVKRLPWTRGYERLEQIRWFASVGEAAYTTLLLLAEDERDEDRPVWQIGGKKFHRVAKSKCPFNASTTFGLASKLCED